MERVSATDCYIELRLTLSRNSMCDNDHVYRKFVYELLFCVSSKSKDNFKTSLKTINIWIILEMAKYWKYKSLSTMYTHTVFFHISTKVWNKSQKMVWLNVPWLLIQQWMFTLPIFQSMFFWERPLFVEKIEWFNLKFDPMNTNDTKSSFKVATWSHPNSTIEYKKSCF